MFLFFALLPMFFLPPGAAHNFLSLSFTFPFYFLHHYTLPAAGLVNHTRRWAAAFFFYLPELRPPSTHPYLSFLYGSAVISIHRRELFIYIKGTGFFSSSSSTVPNFRTKTKKKEWLADLGGKTCRSTCRPTEKNRMTAESSSSITDQRTLSHIY